MKTNINKKRVFLMNFSTPILKDVALELQKGGVEIVYWLGARHYFEEAIQKDKVNFPKTIFHELKDATRNILPKNLDCSSFEPVSKELIKKLTNDESIAFSMLGREDYFNSVFSRKKHVYYEYLKFFNGLLKKFQPDAILFNDAPHFIIGYVSYILAKIFGIKTIMLDIPSINTRCMVMNDYKDRSLLLEGLRNSRGKNFKIEDLDKDIRDYYLNQINPDIDSTPLYKKKIKEARGPLRSPTLKVFVKHIICLTIFKVAFAYLKMFLTKSCAAGIDGDIFGIRLKILANKWYRASERFKKEYLELQIKPDLSKKFIYIPLHLQPEDNTCPMGDVFEDQILMVDIIASSVPDDWVVYVKENIIQWSPNLVRSDLYRYKGYYKKIASLRNTHLIPAEINSFDLINKSQAVATVAGTAGWEAVLMSKPALIFGYVWYMYCEGVFRVSDFNSCKDAINKIVGGYKPDRQKIINFLYVLDKNSIKAKDYKTLGYKEDEYISSGDNVKNLSEAFYNAIIYN